VESRNPIGGVDSKDSKFIKISVSDSGSGMDDETKRRAVEPFYSTKSMTDGTGLGLSVVDGIINQHKGFLTIEDNNPRGLCVNVFIPWAHVTPEKSTEKEKSSQKSNLIVLYAEDDETLRELTTEMLEAEGLTIIEACNGIEALEKYEENKSQIDVILSDVVMPKMGGKELFQKIREIDSEIGFIFMSGYSKKELTSDNDQLPKNSKFLKKPCELDDLLECVSIMGNTKIKKTEVA
jgi:CheY-like chemotaxis protein